MTQHRFSSHEGNLAPGHLEENEGDTSSCSSMSVALIAATVPEDLSEKEMCDLVEHAKTCSACGAILTEYQELRNVLAAFPAKQSANGPTFHVSPRLRAAMVERTLQKQSSQRHRTKPMAVVSRRPRTHEGDRFQPRDYAQRMFVRILAAVVQGIVRILEASVLLSEVRRTSVRKKK